MRASLGWLFGRLAERPPGGRDMDSMGRRALSGRSLRPWPWLTARRIVLLATDVDADAGVAVAWLIRRPGSTRQVEETWLYKRARRGWEGLGGGRGIGGRGIGPGYGIPGGRAPGGPGRAGGVLAPRAGG